MLGSQAQTRPKDTSHSSDEEHKKKYQAKARYFLTWRWHFLCGTVRHSIYDHAQPNRPCHAI